MLYCLYILVWRFEMNPIVNIFEFDIECVKIYANLGSISKLPLRWEIQWSE